MSFRSSAEFAEDGNRSRSFNSRWEGATAVFHEQNFFDYFWHDFRHDAAEVNLWKLLVCHHYDGSSSLNPGTQGEFSLRICPSPEDPCCSGICNSCSCYFSRNGLLVRPVLKHWTHLQQKTHPVGKKGKERKYTILCSGFFIMRKKLI